MSDQPDRTPRAPATTSSRAPAQRSTGGDELPYIDDPVSRAWVVLIITVFSAIFLYALLAGHGGLLTPQPTPSPSPSPSPVVSPTPTGSPTPTTSPMVSPAVTPTPAVSPSPTTAPSPTASPSG